MNNLDLLEKIHNDKPLIHHLTNWVTIYDCANITRAFGALPVMAHSIEEVEEMTSISSALVLNIGTLTPEFIESMIVAGVAANKKGIPVVVDAVGVGATKLRTNSALEILEKINVSVLKGNAGEIGVLAGAKAEVRGVESISVGGKPEELAKTLAGKLDNVVAITGEVDIVASKDEVLGVSNGDEMMGRVVGTGCMATSVIGSFCSVEEDFLNATAIGLGIYGLACERAAIDSPGPGTFKSKIFDEIWALIEKGVEGVKINKIDI